MGSEFKIPAGSSGTTGAEPLEEHRAQPGTSGSASICCQATAVQQQHPHQAMQNPPSQMKGCSAEVPAEGQRWPGQGNAGAHKVGEGRPGHIEENWEGTKFGAKG